MEGDEEPMTNPFLNVYVVLWTIHMTLYSLLNSQFVNNARLSDKVFPKRATSISAAATAGFQLSVAWISKELFHGMPCWMSIFVVLVFMGMQILCYFEMTLDMWVKYPRNRSRQRLGFGFMRKLADRFPNSLAPSFYAIIMIVQVVLALVVLANKVENPYNIGILTKECAIQQDHWLLIVALVAYYLMFLYFTLMLYEVNPNNRCHILLHEQTITTFLSLVLITTYLGLLSNADLWDNVAEKLLAPDILLYLFCMIPLSVSIIPSVFWTFVTRVLSRCFFMGGESPENMGQFITFYDYYQGTKKSSSKAKGPPKRKPVVRDAEEDDFDDDSEDINLFMDDTIQGSTYTPSKVMADLADDSGIPFDTAPEDLLLKNPDHWSEAMDQHIKKLNTAVGEIKHLSIEVSVNSAISTVDKGSLKTIFSRYPVLTRPLFNRNYPESIEPQN